MEAIPRDVPKPLVGFNILSVMRIDIVTCVITARRRRLILDLISFGAKAIIFLLDDTSDQVLASSAHCWLGRETESFLVVLWYNQSGYSNKMREWKE